MLLKGQKKYIDLVKCMIKNDLKKKLSYLVSVQCCFKLKIP